MIQKLTVETFRFQDENDYMNKIFSILSIVRAAAWASAIWRQNELTKCYKFYHFAIESRLDLL